MIKKSLSDPIIISWLALIVLTLITWVIGLEHGFDGANGVVIGMAAVLAIAFFKVHIIGQYFMEVRDAPIFLKFAFAGWVWGVGGMVIGLYVWGK